MSKKLFTIIDVFGRYGTEERSEDDYDTEPFWEEFRRRRGYKNKSMLFRLYFVLAVIICAGFGVIFPIISWAFVGSWAFDEHANAIFQSMTTYAIAIAATAFVDFIVSEADKDNKSAGNPFKRSFNIVLIIFFIIVFFSTVWTYFPTNRVFSSASVIFGAALALFIWWVANADNSDLLEDIPSPKAATGGDVDLIKGSEGDLSKEGLGK